jgi:LPXTG-site transpeptidase (sortase) family protein
VWVTVSVLVMLLVFGFVFHIVVVSQVEQMRRQSVLLSDFRADLANAVAPVQATDEAGTPIVPGTAIAILSIPKIGVDQVVVEGTASGDTQSGPGHKRGTPLPGQPGVSVLFGRQAAYGGPFGALGQLAPGDPITVVTGQGTHEFRVLDVRYEGDPLPPTLAAGKGRLTLVTASGSGYLPSGVVRVDAELTSEIQPGGTQPAGLGSLPAEQVMAGDPSSWVGILLWAQALLVTVLVMTWCLMRWGIWQSWLVGLPVIGFVAFGLFDQVAQLLPNLL